MREREGSLVLVRDSEESLTRDKEESLVDPKRLEDRSRLLRLGESLGRGREEETLPVSLSREYRLRVVVSRERRSSSAVVAHLLLARGERLSSVDCFLR